MKLLKKKKKYPNLLVISNNSLSENNSNGRTLSGFLRGWKKECIAQIYITGESPSSRVCEKFFRITDKEVLGGIFNKNRIGQVIKNNENKNSLAIPNNSVGNKTIFKMILRDLIWSTNIWWNKNLKTWLDEFSPDVILFFAGESVFTYKITMKLAQFYNIPIIVYNSEGYYFKEKNYLKNSSIISELLYPIFHKNFRRVFKKLMKRAHHAIYINDMLKKDYDKEFYLPSTTVFTASYVKAKTSESNNIIPKVSYLGNLGVGRHIPLCEIAETLCEINENYKLDVYGRIPNKEVKKTFEQCKGINYCGVVSYSEVVDIMHDSDLLVHAESFDEFAQWDLKYAFTTKIADSLACGTSFFVYAPESLACSEYIIKNDITFISTKKTGLKQMLENALFDSEMKKIYIQKGLEISKKNHDSVINCNKFYIILTEVLKNARKNESFK